MKRRTATALSIAVVLSLAAAPRSAPAASNGLAWDSVTKIAMNADPSSLQPGDFNADFATASNTQMPEQQSGGGIFAQMRQAMSMGQSMQQMMQNGFAMRQYVAGSKERTDMLSMQRAMIYDCTTRTMTTLDLRRKTYRVESLDHPSSTSGGGGAGAQSGGADDTTRVAITLRSTALGPRDVGGQPTNGYRADMTITETKSSGESQTQKADMLGYYTSMARPRANCYNATAISGGRAAGMMMGNYAQVMRALGEAGVDSRFSVTQSGPALPLGKLEMYDATTFASQNRGGSMTFVVENGNVRSISSDDPVFNVPSDFTKDDSLH
jgi:hypothetical protein